MLRLVGAHVHCSNVKLQLCCVSATVVELLRLALKHFSIISSDRILALTNSAIEVITLFCSIEHKTHENETLLRLCLLTSFALANLRSVQTTGENVCPLNVRGLQYKSVQLQWGFSLIP